MNLLIPASRRGYRQRILLDLAVLLLALGVLWAGMGFPLAGHTGKVLWQPCAAETGRPALSRRRAQRPSPHF